MEKLFYLRICDYHKLCHYDKAKSYSLSCYLFVSRFYTTYSTCIKNLISTAKGCISQCNFCHQKCSMYNSNFSHQNIHCSTTGFFIFTAILLFCPPSFRVLLPSLFVISHRDIDLFFCHFPSLGIISASLAVHRP